MVNKQVLSCISVVMLMSSLPAWAAKVDCSIERIEALTVEQQMKRYSICNDLMEKRIALLKKQKEMEKIIKGNSNAKGTKQMAGIDNAQIAFPSSMSSLPSVMTNQKNKNVDNDTINENLIVSTIVVSSIVGVGDNLLATLKWQNGKTIQVSKGMTVSGYKILDVTIDGVKAKRVAGKGKGKKSGKGEVIFIPVGEASKYDGMRNSAPPIGSPVPGGAPSFIQPY